MSYFEFEVHRNTKNMTFLPRNTAHDESRQHRKANCI
nr:uncharacterized protein CTRU02_08304 [Colletotrichum truncatum]KAF6790175.1 hypothetical protein CTRU02_08304 [Colletotrichum truncatum]